nr:immunoglobulin light chain junction region [Macaca mulatta]MOX12644.1 immunoglobulin light chain junction region [Macaca mulatta]MOX12713.1 immunoglobulin light chain junction region [Macaca mulatta]MOX12849.1 immunoglobulin light chain junction region [Macaca mulatta]MOX12970.1 immunoglobulin light chain junction region [Macaca mulatta]
DYFCAVWDNSLSGPLF